MGAFLAERIQPWFPKASSTWDHVRVGIFSAFRVVLVLHRRWENEKTGTLLFLCLLVPGSSPGDATLSGS